MHANPARDQALCLRIQEFLDGTLTHDELAVVLRDYARQFEADPYLLGTAPIAWEDLPRERLFKFVEISSEVTGPAMQAFLEGRLTPAEAALTLAPFFLIWGGYGIDPPPEADETTRRRLDELLAKIGEFAAS